MSELGIGTRVWVGYTDSYRDELKGSLCEKGTIVDGPFEKGDMIYEPKRVVHARGWNVEMDNGYGVFTAERILFPIDDRDEHTQEEKEDETVLL